MQVPSKEQVDGLSAELSTRGKDIPQHVQKVLAALPPGTHPMVQFSAAVLALQVCCLTALRLSSVWPLRAPMHCSLNATAPTNSRHVPSDCLQASDRFRTPVARELGCVLLMPGVDLLPCSRTASLPRRTRQG